MTSAAQIDAPKTEQALTVYSKRPTPVRSAITASAARLTGRDVKRAGAASIGRKSETTWQGDAWEMFDLVGEEHFLATTLAQRIGQAHLYVGRVNADDVNAVPEPVEEGHRADVIDNFAHTNAQREQILGRAGVNLFVAGEGWLAGVPNALVESGGSAKRQASDPRVAVLPGGESGFEEAADLDDLEWRFLSTDEMKVDDGKVTLEWFGAPGGKISEVSEEEVLLIRVWKPHPRKFSEPDSPTRASLPVLRELVGLTMHVSAQIDSRLAGAGLLAVRQSVKDSAETSDDPNEEGDVSSFEDSLIDTMVTPISDRSNASALVPLVVGVPNDLEGPVSDHFHYQEFTTPLDGEARALRDEAIRRLALGQDTPPELLLGVGSMNHWGAWLVREDVITTHVEPYVALVCDALTSEFLWPLLEAQGMPPEEARDFVVWYSVDHLISRPNRSEEAQALFDRGVISAETLRRETGYSDSDAPKVEGNSIDPAVERAFEMVAGAPSLAQSPGLPALVEQIRAVLAGPEETAAAAAEGVPGDGGASAGDDPEPQSEDSDTGGGDGGVPSTANDPAQPGDAPALAAGGRVSNLGLNEYAVGPTPGSTFSADLAAIRRADSRRAVTRG